MKISLYIAFADGRNPYMRYGLTERELRKELSSLKRSFVIVSAKEEDSILSLALREKTEIEKAIARKAEKKGKASYQSRKEAARQAAIDWQNDYANHNYSYDDLAVWQDHFRKLGKRYGLTEEFKQNGVI